jgi:hypothetical protein
MTDDQAGAGDAASHLPKPQITLSDNQTKVELHRASMGLYAVLASDIAIAVAAIAGVLIIRHDSASTTAVVSILSTAFTAVGTLTTAYFGIKATANTAKNTIAGQQSGASGDPQ